MKREIKFRAYDTFLKKMVSTGFDVIGEVTMFAMVEQYCFETKEDVTNLERVKDIVLMQYTGLDDKNGIEIYEGDIIGNGQAIFTIKWSEEYFAFLCERLSGPDKLLHELSDVIQNRYSIIGNVFDNQQLLTP